MKLIIGLGNPGDKFNNTRHNIGFESLDLFAQKNNIKFLKKHKSFFYKSNGFILLKPQTFMNLSGDAVAEVVKFYKIKLEDILIVYDDVSLEFGKIRTKFSGSSGGQNGVKDIITKLGTDQFWRTKLGVGFDKRYELSKWVLSKFKKDELDTKNEILESACTIIDLFIKEDTLEIMNRFN